MEIWHVWGGDLAIGPTGDVLQVSGVEEGRQRVLRRLLTTLRNYIWHLDYGGSLPLMVGQPADAYAIEGIVRQQMALEGAVAQTPEPTVSVSTDGAGGTFLVITYTDAGSGQSVALGPADGLQFGGS
jgi:hypothetical protein